MKYSGYLTWILSQNKTQNGMILVKNKVSSPVWFWSTSAAAIISSNGRFETMRQSKPPTVNAQTPYPFQTRLANRPTASCLTENPPNKGLVVDLGNL